MLTGFYVVKMGIALYTPSFPRGGQAALFSLDVQAVVGGSSPAMTPTVETKNRSDATWTTAGAFTSITTTGVKTKDIAAGILLEEVRIKFEYTAGVDLSNMYIVMGAPAWRAS